MPLDFIISLLYIYSMEIKNKKTKWIPYHLNLTEKEHAYIKESAKRMGMSIRELLVVGVYEVMGKRTQEAMGSALRKIPLT